LRFRILSIAMMALVQPVNAGEGVKLYEFQGDNTTLYQTTCGNSGEEGWEVNKNSCNLYTSTTEYRNPTGNSDSLVIVKTTIKNSGNLEPRDFAWIFYYLNNKVIKSITVRGDIVGKGVTIVDSIYTTHEDKLRLRISFVCDGDNEYWLLPDGGISIYLPDGKEEFIEIEELKKPDLTIEANMEEDHIHVTWLDSHNTSNNYYLIERSIDGRRFEFLGYVKSGVIKNNKLAYSYTDNTNSDQASFYKVSTYSASGKKLNVLGVVSVSEDNE
jgi:hypothetical protein